MPLSDKANNVNWLMANFVRSTPGGGVILTRAKWGRRRRSFRPS